MLKRSAVRSGDAYVQLAGERSVEKALSLNRKYLGSRYIEGVLSAGYLPSVISVMMIQSFYSDYIYVTITMTTTIVKYILQFSF